VFSASARREHPFIGWSLGSLNKAVRTHRAALAHSRFWHLTHIPDCRLSDAIDLQEPSEELVIKTEYLKEKLAKLESGMQRLAAMEQRCSADQGRGRRQRARGARWYQEGRSKSDPAASMAQAMTTSNVRRLASFSIASNPGPDWHR
jgi:hypothetical protein